jgi:hypothetical protein
VKQLSSRWAAAAFLAPVLIIFAILLAGVQGPEAAATPGKGRLQIAFTGVISPLANLSYQSLFLNVVSVRLNPSTDPSVSEGDPGWQEIGVPTGTINGLTSPALTFGTNFGPNGSSVGLGQGRSEIQIDLAQLQGGIQVFNTGKIKATTYNQIELVLDPVTPGNIVTQCGNGPATGEGCIIYPMQLAANAPPIRFTASKTITRKSTELLGLAINVIPEGPPTASNQPVLIKEVDICALGNATAPPLCPFTLNSSFVSGFGGVITDTVDNATSKGEVNAELVGTGTVISSVPVDKTTHQYTMVLPVGNYDMYATSGSGHTIDAHQNVAIPTAGSYPQPGQSPDPFHFSNITHKATNALSGVVADGCTGSAIPGATLEVYAPPSLINQAGTYIDCAPPSPAPTPAACPTTCGFTLNNGGGTTDPEIPQGCMIVATTSTTNTGAFPPPGSGAQTSPFKLLPEMDREGVNEYALKATAAGYNTELLAASTHSNGLFTCKGSGFPLKNGIIPCGFSLPRGEIDVLPNVGTTPLQTSPLNVLVNIEDSGTFNGENVGMVNIPVGATAPMVAQPIFLPAVPTVTPSPPTPTPTATPTTSKATPTPTPVPTPVFISGPAFYDLFASVQDLFGAAPQKASGHTIEVQAAIPAPWDCQDASSGATTATPGPLSCVGHGSVAGSFTGTGFPDQNTLIVVSKADTNKGGQLVDLMADGVAQSASFNNFAICAPADPGPYTVTHFETVPSASPSPVGSTTTMLTGPIVIGAGSPAPTPLCQGICSDFAPAPNKTCLLCQGTAGSISLP